MTNMAKNPFLRGKFKLKLIYIIKHKLEDLGFQENY